MREVGFLGVVIKLKEIKIKGVSDWLTSKYVRDI